MKAPEDSGRGGNLITSLTALESDPLALLTPIGKLL